MANELITIGITCFNAQDTIRRAVNSALSQVWENTEIIVVDDFSTDGSVEILHEMSKQYEKIRIIPHEVNKGVGAARNTILTAAKGDFVVFFDDDDESRSQRITVQRAYLKQYEESSSQSLIGCYCSGERRYKNGYTQTMPAIGSQPKVPFGPDVANYLLLNERLRGYFYGAGTPASALMARTETLKAVGGFDAEFRRVEDIDLAVRLALLGGHFIGCPERLFIRHATSGGDKTAEVNFLAEMRLLKKHKLYLEHQNAYSYAVHWFKFRYLHFSGQEFLAFLELLKAFRSNPTRATTHFIRSGPRRLLHELRMKRNSL